MGRPEQDFLKYRRKGDTRALARVFDRLAPELLLLALHLTKDHSRAEDLIQETFLRAMEVADRFLPGSRLRPWLGGILTNAAREARRAEARSVEPDSLNTSPTEDPAESAQSHELVARLGSAVESLPRTYHQVLILRLSKGMTAVEIAHALGRRPATVHTQLQRGMDLLRRALPTGFALPAFAGLLQARGLAHVRQAVMQRASTSVGTVAGIGLASGPLLFLGKVMIPVGLVGGLSYLAMGQLSPDAVAGSPGARPEIAAVTTDPPAADAGGRARSRALSGDAPQVTNPQQGPGVAFATAPTEAPAESPSTEPVREVLEADPAGEVTDLPELAQLRGRCLAAETGLPLAGCTVSFRGSIDGSRVALYGEVPWEEPEPVVTGADGRFEIAFAAEPHYRHSLRILAENRVLRTGRFGAFEPGQVEDVGDISFELGYEVEGLVVDESGVSVEGASVSLGDLPLPMQHGYIGTALSGSSDAEGHFAIAGPIPPGTWPLEVSTRGLSLRFPDSVTVREGVGAQSVQVVVKRMPWMSGTVLDETGAPASGVSLRARSDVGGRIASARTEQDGTFLLYSVRDDQGSVMLEGGGRGGYEPFEDDGFYEWGATDVRLVVRRAQSFELRVVERGTGVPVEDYAVICHSLTARSSGQTSPRLGGHHPEGKVVVDEVWRGVNRLVVLPRNPELMLSGTIEFEAFETGAAPMVVELKRMPTHPVRVLTEAGEPVAGSRVELIVKGSHEFDANLPAGRPREGQEYGGSPGWFAQELLSEGKTDANGQVSLPVPTGVPDLNLRVIGDTHLPASKANVVFPGDGSAVVLVVSCPGTLSGTVIVDGFDPSRMFVVVTHQDGRPLRMLDTTGPMGGRVEIEQDGSFVLPGLYPGEYSVGLGEGTRALGGELRSVTVRAGETVEVTLDGTRYKPGTLRGRVFLDGVALSKGRVRVQGTNSGGQFTPDDEGRFEAEGLLPGEYRVAIEVGGDGAFDGDPIVSKELVAIQPGGEVAKDLHFSWQKMRVRLLEADGKTALSEVNVLVLSAGLMTGLGFNTKTTDSDGWITLDPAPGGEVRFQVLELGRAGVLGPVEIPAGEREATFELRMDG